MDPDEKNNAIGVFLLSRDAPELNPDGLAWMNGFGAGH
jgi:hypothetical protein